MAGAGRLDGSHAGSRVASVAVPPPATLTLVTPLCLSRLLTLAQVRQVLSAETPDA